MKKPLLLFLFFVFYLGYSQNPMDKIQNYLNDNKTDLGLSRNDISDWSVKSTGSSKATEIDNYYLVQNYNGIEVFNSVSNLWYKKNSVINFQNSFISNIATKINSTTPSLSILDAFSSALNNVNESYFPTFILEEKSDKVFLLSNGNLLDDPIYGQLVYQSVNNNSAFRLAWHFEFYTQNYNHLWSLRVDALTGELLEKHDGVLNCVFGNSNHSSHNHKVSNFSFVNKAFKSSNSNSILEIASGSYRVVPFEIESPNHGPRQLVATPHNVLASPYGWHDTNGVAGAEYTVTRGNNVWAVEDANGNNGIGASPNGGAGLNFDFAYGGNGVAASTYTDASTTNLFYMNNIMHDVWYNYGFNEANGNFQQNNYGRGGAQSDYVNADAQDGSGTNNANFSTPADGSKPRMQMYLWDQGPSPTLTVNSPGSVVGVYGIRDNSFSPGHVAIPASPGLTRNFVLFDDGVPDTSDACTAAVNGAALNGNIAVIRRGNCTFAEKVKFAQNVGAVAVIIVNNVAGEIGMAGADATITIPAVSINQTDGEALILAMSTSTVNGTLEGAASVFVNADGDFDNGIIAHEYGHGISTRLTGGPSTSCLNNAEQMGEGWSDFFALMLQMKSGDLPGDSHGIGTFAMSQPTNAVGIRSYAYSTDMSINPFTFASSNTQVAPHGVGSVWATMLWDLAWAYVGKYGFDADKFNGTGGNNKVMQLVLDGLKLQGCSPTFVTGRNALIAADQATTGGQNFCLIWDVFARRGLGVGASSGSATSSTDQVENFTTPAPGPNCTLTANYFQNEDMIKIYPNPTNGLLNVRVSNYTNLLNVQIFDLNGRRVYVQSVNDFSIERSIDVQSLQKGIYLLKIDGVDLAFTKKIVIN